MMSREAQELRYQQQLPGLDLPLKGSRENLFELEDFPESPTSYPMDVDTLPGPVTEGAENNPINVDI